MKPAESLEQLDEMIAREKHNVSEEIVREAWEDAANDGIEPEIIARSAIKFALRSVVAEHGEMAARALADEIPELFNGSELLGEIRLN